MDNELFELCKKVYERTKDTWGWTDEMQWIEVNHFGEVSIFPKWRSLSDNSAEVQKHAPLYTSDYLLEKLPQGVSVYKEQLAYAYNAGLPKVERQVSDTPLKALLKLTIALHESGELK